MNVIFIGASHWHLPLYLDPLLRLPGMEVVGVSDPDPVVTGALASRLGCRGDTDYRQLCRTLRPDFVFALGRHADMVEEAAFLLDEAIPFAIEKPCGLRAADVERLAELQVRSGGFAAVPLVMRNGAFLGRMRAMADDGIQYMSYRFIAGFAARYLAAGCGWMLDPALAGGGCTINLGIHFFDLCTLLFGKDARVRSAVMSNAAWNYPVEDYSVVTVEHGCALCVIETGYLYPAPTSSFDMHFALRSPRHYLVARDQGNAEILTATGEREVIETGTTNVPQYPVFVADVLARVRDGRPPLAGFADLLPAMALVDQAYAAAGPLSSAASRPSNRETDYVR